MEDEQGRWGRRRRDRRENERMRREEGNLTRINDRILTHMIQYEGASLSPTQVLDIEGHGGGMGTIGAQIVHTLVKPDRINVILVRRLLSDSGRTHNHARPIIRELEHVHKEHVCVHM